MTTRSSQRQVTSSQNEYHGPRSDTFPLKQSLECPQDDSLYMPRLVQLASADHGQTVGSADPAVSRLAAVTLL